VLDEDALLGGEEDVVFDGCEKSPVILTCLIGPGSKELRTNDGLAVQTV
jgi:hypothetical protein